LRTRSESILIAREVDSFGKNVNIEYGKYVKIWFYNAIKIAKNCINKVPYILAYKSNRKNKFNDQNFIFFIFLSRSWEGLKTHKYGIKSCFPETNL
jgi:hypothetical protein